MRFTFRRHLLGTLALGTVGVSGLWYSLWTYRRALLEIVGFNPGNTLFGVGIGIGALTVIKAWADALAGIANREPGQQRVRPATLGVWISRLVLKTPVAIFLPFVLLNAILLVLALGLVKAKEIIPTNQSAVPATTISIANIAIGQISLAPIRHVQRESGSAFIYPVPSFMPFVAQADSSENPTYSSTIVSENGRPLGPSHSLHDTIRKVGQGTYSHWSTGWTKPSSLYFSAADNTSPLQNGRTYSVEYVMGFHPVAAVLIILMSLPLYIRVYCKLSDFFPRRSGPLTQKTSAIIPYAILFLGLSLFMLPLFTYWETGKTGVSVIGGLLPWSDASGWLYGTHYLLKENTLLWWTARHPVYPAFMSFLAFVTGEDLPAMLILRTVLVGITCLLAASEIWLRYGTIAGISMFGLLLAFVSPFTPTTLTESLGLAFSAVAFAMMWQAISKDDLWRFACGLFLLALAMSVRPGAILVLPFLAVWAIFNLRTRDVTVASRSLLIALSALAALSIILLWTHFYGTGKSFPAANYSFTFYGLAFGGKPWQQFFVDHPDATYLSEIERVTLAYQAGISEIVRNPTGLIIGLASFTELYFNHLFIYIGGSGFRLVARILAALGIFSAARRFRKDPHNSFLFCGAAGILFSAPFIFWASDAYRALIVTAPFEAVLVVVGLTTLIDAARLLVKTDFDLERAYRPPRHERVIFVTTTVFCVSLVFGCTLGPAVAVALHHPSSFASAKCEGQLTPVIIQLGKSSPFIEVVTDNSDAIHAPQVTIREFHADLNVSNIEIEPTLRKIAPGGLLIHGYDLRSRTDIGQKGNPGFERLWWIVASAAQLPKPGRYYLVCGRERKFSTDFMSIQVLFAVSAREIAPMQH